MIGSLLERSDLYQDAAFLASLLDKGMAQRDRAYDAILGSAGTILGLLALHKVTRDCKLLDKAAEFGQHLIIKQEVQLSVQPGARLMGLCLRACPTALRALCWR